MTGIRAVVATLLATLTVLALALTRAAAPATADDGSHRYERKGLDKCSVPTHPVMKKFWDGTPWWWWGLYIGGGSMACDNDHITANWLDIELDRGYGFMPIWVGKQAPCTNFAHRFSYDTSKAYDQGYNNARRAYLRILDLGMATNTPIAFDLEGFNTGNAACVAAAKAFIRGWSAHLRIEPAQKPGVYGSSCSSALSKYWDISPRPEFIWGANWDNTPNVYDLSCVSSNIWGKRHKQYRGKVKITANGTTRTVDVDCAQGPMYGRYARRSSECR